MTSRRVFAIGFVAMLAAMKADAGNRAGDCVTIYIKHAFLVDSYVLRIAEHTAGSIFDDIGVSVEWKHFASQPVGDACVAIHVEFDSELPSKYHSGALAYALPYAAGGTQIHVDANRVQRRPALNQSGAMLGCVLAHEIGHVLERVNRHSRQGIMKAAYTNDDLPGILRHSLRFANEDVDLIHKGLASRVTMASGVRARPPGATFEY
ncbi:MAG: hypothetical protein C5B51_16445 [Terriglobia bacterium]|nr:MAG: hypothetical protein C5B51_16445 [Terriglobia bacterium]